MSFLLSLASFARCVTISSSGLLTVVWMTRDAHNQLLMANVIEKLSKGHEDLPFIVKGVPHLQHGSLSPCQVPHHPLRVVLIASRLGPVQIGLHKGQSKEAMADHISVNPLCLLFVEMVQDPFIGI